jgi:hypothetical protein
LRAVAEPVECDAQDVLDLLGSLAGTLPIPMIMSMTSENSLSHRSGSDHGWHRARLRAPAAAA